MIISYSQLSNNRINLREAIPLKKPFTILFEPASICNFKCTCCYYNLPDVYTHMARGIMRWDVFQKIANDLADWEGDKIKVIRLIGFGEPFINSNTTEMVRYLKELNIAERIEITSNCSLLTPYISRRLVDVELDYLRASIYAATQERHEIVTKNRMNLNIIRENLVELRLQRGHRDKPFIYVKMLDSFDPEENHRFIDMYSGIADEVAIEQPHNWLSSSGLIGSSICPQPFKMLSIRQNGDVIVCDPDWMNNTLMGNAFKENIKNIWNNPKLAEFWKMQLEHRRGENESCRNCTFVESDTYILDDLEKK